MKVYILIYEYVCMYVPSWGHTHRTHKEFGFLFDDDVNQLGQGSLGIIVIGFTGISSNLTKKKKEKKKRGR